MRGLYKTAEDAIGPRLPRPIRTLWRRLIGRPPLPPPRIAPEPPAVESEVPSGRFDVVCFPIIAWSFRFQRPQQLMRELGRRGHRVFWIDPDAVRDGTGEGRGAMLAPNVHEIRLASARPRDPFRDALEPEDVAPLLEALAALQREAGLTAVVAVVQLPFWAPLARAAAAKLRWRIVYDCMDDHAAFSTNDSRMLAGEEALLEGSELVVVTSRRLREHVAGRAGNLVAIPNACDWEHFAKAAGDPACPASLATVPRPIIGYVGAISEWFDFDLLRDAIEKHPEWSFVLVGSTWGAPEHGDLAAKPNVQFLGEQPYETVPALVSRFDVACIPFSLTTLIEATDPVKLYEYLAAGKPVVASRLPELAVHAGLGELVSLVDSGEAFTAAVAEALRTDGPEKRAARRAFARANTWEARAEVLVGAIEATFPLASVAVVTWNNWELSRRCLASVLEDRTWPELEVIVVDNASSDATRAELQKLAEREPRVRLVLNEENRGFAAANNQAIALARGSYVVLLNNDTVVPRGWLARLARVLESAPRIGLLGPVTDGVWNEARVEGLAIDGEAREALDAFAARWARDHAERLYPISMLAMYCVAARREVIDAIGPLDERFGIGMFEDDDYAHRVRAAGYRVVCAEETFVHHAGQASFDMLARKDALWEENRSKFEEKWDTTWRPPGLGTRAQTLAQRDEVDRWLRANAAGRRPAIVLRARDEGAVSDPAETVAAVLAELGHAVIDVRAPAAKLEAQALRETGPGLAVSTLPLEAFESLIGAIVLPSAARTFELAYFAEALLLYVDEPQLDSVRRREARDAFHRSAVVLSSPFGEEQVRAALAALEGSQAASASR